MTTAKTAGRLFFGACLTATFSAAAATEATGTLSQTEGFTVVSKGAQYVEAHEGMMLNEGDRLMVMEGGSAVITFADGCQYTLADNELLTVGQESTCASAAVDSYKVDPYSAVSQDSRAAATGYRQASTGVSGGAAGDDDGDLAWWPPALAGGVFLAAVLLDTGSDTRDSISP